MALMISLLMCAITFFFCLVYNKTGENSLFDLYGYAYILDALTIFLLQAGFRKAHFGVLHSHLFLLKMQ